VVQRVGDVPWSVLGGSALVADHTAESVAPLSLPLAGRIEHADAFDWLEAQPEGEATALIYDPPYAVGTPVRGREDGAAGSVFGPLAFMNKTLARSAKLLRPGGIVMIFADWRRMPDLAYICSTVGLRPSTQIAWVRTRPGTGGLFRSSWDPILIASRGVPDAIDRAAIRNVVEANYPSKRRHPYEKPVEVYDHVLQRICRPGDLVLDPFAGSGNSRVSAEKLGLRWRGCDVDPDFAEVAS
jgi:site-specific DNA-methyltransferase (adenine-specific)